MKKEYKKANNQMDEEGRKRRKREWSRQRKRYIPGAKRYPSLKQRIKVQQDQYHSLYVHLSS
jgi:hypothetical protein